MTKNINYVSHKKSKLKTSGGKPQLPSASALVEGEIAINYAENVETLSIKNESGDVVTFSSDNYYTEQKLGSGFTKENSANTVTSVIETLVGSGFTSSSITDVIIENEEIISTALIDLDDRKLDASAYTPTDLSNYYKKSETSGATELSTAFDAVNASIEDLSGQSETVAVALNELNDNKLDASAYTPVEIIVDQVIDSGTSASTNAVATKAVVNKLIEDEETWAISLNELNNKKFGYADFDSTNKHIEFYKDSDDASTGTPISTVDLSSFSIDIDQVIDSGTSASTNAVATSAVYGFVTSYTPSITVDQVLDDTTSASTNPVSSKAVYKALTDNELVWTNAYVAMSGAISSHTENTEIHVTAADKTNWNAKVDASTLSDYYKKSETSGATELTTAFSAKADTATTLAGYGITNAYTKSETSGATELSTAFSAKADTATTLAGYGITNAYTKSETSGATELSTAFDAVNTSIETLVGSGFTSSSITEVIIENEEIISTALIDLDDRKLDASAYTPTDLSNYYKKSETSGATELSTAFDAVNTSIEDLSGQSETVAVALNELNDRISQLEEMLKNLNNN